MLVTVPDPPPPVVLIFNFPFESQKELTKNTNLKYYHPGKYFPVAGVQTVILSTDEEIIGQYYKAFKPYVGKEYLCSEKPKTQQAEIKEGYF